jgi:hypothetical protein
MRKRLILMIGVATLLFASAAAAHFQVNVYTHSQCPPSPPGSRIDPVNFVFYDVGTTTRAVNHTQYHAGWYDDGGSSQNFADHTGCYAMDAQRASQGVSSTRFHIRFHQFDHQTEYGWTSVGDAHHEDLVWHCGHAVDSNGPNGSGFDQGRRELRIRLEAGGHPWWSSYWGNTANFRQCDGDYAASDGTTVWAGIPNNFH